MVNNFFLVLSWFWFSVALAQQNTQVPSNVEQEAQAISDQFAAVLAEECPGTICYSVGCTVSRFVTLDEKQTSSLPGLETGEDPKMALQYKLSSVRCEFTHEPGFDEKKLTALKQRIYQRIKPVGVAVQLVNRKLEPKPAADTLLGKEPETTLVKEPSLREELYPFIPWFILIILGTLSIITLIWGFRRINRAKVEKPGDEKNKGKGKLAGVAGLPAVLSPEQDMNPSAQMLMARIGQVRDQLNSDPKLVELALKYFFDHNQIDELVLFLKHFGPAYLQSFKEKTEYHQILNLLSEKYHESQGSETSLSTWKFLERLERSLVSARVRIEELSLGEEFAFLNSLTPDELRGLLGTLDEQDSIVTIFYAPKSLRERLFAMAGPAFAAEIVQKLSRVKDLPDAYVREVARRLRQTYATRARELRTVHINRVPLLEQALNVLEPEQRRHLISDIETKEPQFFQEFVTLIFLDDSLQHMPNDLLTEAFLMLSPEEGAAYLQSFPLGKTILKRLNQRLQDAISAFFIPNQLPNSIIANTARERVANFFKEKDALGVINLRRINEKIIG